jgi:hypothetical protein
VVASWVFQPRKVERSGLWHAFDNRVLIYVHKEQELDDVERFYPADHYVLVDDKLHILSAVKRIWGERVTTVFPKQGHYAHDPKTLSESPPADIELATIKDLIRSRSVCIPEEPRQQSRLTRNGEMSAFGTKRTSLSAVLTTSSLPV